MNTPLVSVVTVCYNAEDLIEETALSVVSQKYANLEYVIVDGKSSDHTLDVLYNIQKQYEEKLQFSIVSEKDSGIYNAMNKAIGMLKGDWVLFLNAGDKLFDENVISKWISELDNDVDFCYGNVICIDEEDAYEVQSKEISTIKKDIPFCHQAILNRVDVIKSLLYNEKYKICADYEMYLRAYLEGKCFQKLNHRIAFYKLGGYSQNHLKHLIVENAVIRKEKGLIRFLQFNILINILRMYIGKIIKFIFPEAIVKKIRNNSQKCVEKKK